jgi:monoamine oxidase
MNNSERVIIIGGGLSGLTLAWLLKKKNIPTLLLEASSRLGGRIQTVKGAKDTPLELGATWLGEQHIHLSGLLHELGLQTFPQLSKGISLFQTKSFEPPQQFFVPEAEQSSYRIAGGTQSIIHALASRLDPSTIRTNAAVSSITKEENTLSVVLTTGEVLPASKVVICLPPQLAAAVIRFTPELPADVKAILPTVQTWMAGALKFAIEYEQPFWRKKGFSGMLFSHADIVVEMYDHSNREDNRFGFTGFLNGGAAGFSKEVRKENVLRQLTELMGEEAGQPLTYVDKVWNDEFVLHGNQVIQRPHQNNGHPLLLQSYLGGRLFFCGTETSTAFPGYMEGAVQSAKRIAEKC